MRLRRLKFGFARVEESLGTFRGETFEIWVSFNSTCRSASEWDNEVADQGTLGFFLHCPVPTEIAVTSNWQIDVVFIPLCAESGFVGEGTWWLPGPRNEELGAFG